jgi:hypothetical protein
MVVFGRARHSGEGIKTRHTFRLRTLGEDGYKAYSLIS